MFDTGSNRSKASRLFRAASSLSAPPPPEFQPLNPTGGPS